LTWSCWPSRTQPRQKPLTLLLHQPPRSNRRLNTQRPVSTGRCCFRRWSNDAKFPVGAGLPAMAACQPTPISQAPQRSNCGSGLAREGGLSADAYLPGTPTIQLWELACLRWRPASRRLSPRHPNDPTVGAGLPAMAACQPTPISQAPQRSNCGSGLARDGGLPADAYLPGTPTIQLWERACSRRRPVSRRLSPRPPNDPTVRACSRRRPDRRHSYTEYISIPAVTAT